MIECSRVSGIRTPVSKMGEFAGKLPRKFITSSQLGSESSAHNLLEEPESENLHNVAERDETNTVGIGETSTFPAKYSSSFQGAAMRAESNGENLKDENHVLTMALKDCVLTNSDDDVEDLSAFVTERLQWLSDGSVEKLIGDESVNVEEILCGNVGVEEGDGYKRQSVSRDVTIGGNVGASDGRFFRAKKLIRICWRSRVVRTSLRLREGLHGPYTPKDAAVCSAVRRNHFAKRWFLMWLVGVGQLEASICQEGMLLRQVKVCPRALWRVVGFF